MTSPRQSSANNPAWTWASRYFREYETPAEVIAHSLKVNELANFFARHAQARDLKIDPELVNRASLVHDFYRGRADKGHQKKGGTILKKENPLLGRIVACHGLKSILKKSCPRTLEERIVFLADKLVLSDAGVIVDVGTKIVESQSKPWRKEAKEKALKMLRELLAEIGMEEKELEKLKRKT
jgi:HD superfamily phosphodiesterase